MTINRTTLLALALVLLGTSAATAQQNPHGKLAVTSFPKPYLFLIRDPVVHADLKLSPEQQTAVDQLNDQLDVDLWAMRNKSPEHVEQTVAKSIATAKTQLGKVLTRQQQKRLVQIEYWTLGTKAFLQDDLPAQLKLTDKQREEVRATVTKTQEALAELSAKSAEEPREKLEQQARQLQIDEQNKLLATITDEQREQWVKLMGEPIEVNKLGAVKFKAPEILSQEGAWINSPPTSLAQLRGKVVAVHFYAFQCINCRRNLPAYSAWHKSYANKGLVVLGIHTPELSSERDIDNVRDNAYDVGLKFPIVTDNDQQNWNAWGNTMWPSVYLVDKQGYVRYWWYGELNWQGAEGEQMMRQRIEELLAEE